jgi:tetratricopeptide (TPR) repeat protein
VTNASLRKILMRRARLILASAVIGTCLPFFLPAQTRAALQENLAPPSAPRDLSDLELNSELRLELEDALNRREYKRAEAILVEEAKHDPKSIRAARLLVTAAGIFFLDGQYLNSVVAWKKAEAITPLDDRSRFTLAMAYVRLNRRDWARPELEKLASARPQNPLYLYWLARLDYDAGNYASAISRLKDVIELDPSMMRAYDTLGLCYDYLGKFDDAIKNYDRAVALNRLQSKPSPWPHVDLAISLIAVNQLAKAEKSLREAISYDPKLPQAHYQLGRVLEMQGGYQTALESLKQAAALDAAYPEPHYLLGRIYHRLRNDSLSKAEIDRFQELKRASEAPGVPQRQR